MCRQKCNLSCFIAAELHLASYESEGPENNLEKDSRRSLRWARTHQKRSTHQKTKSVQRLWGPELIHIQQKGIWKDVCLHFGNHGNQVWTRGGALSLCEFNQNDDKEYERIRICVDQRM